MAGSVNFSNHQWLVQSFDTNNNGKMEELQLDPRVANKVDSDRNGEVSAQELTAALRNDSVEINQGRIVGSAGTEIFVHGLETLKNVNSTARSSWGNVWAPTMYQDDTPEERYGKLQESNRAYGSAIDRMESALRSIKSMTNGATDATSKALNIQAKTALNSASWRTWIALFERLGDNGYASQENISQLQQANTNMQAAYETLNNTLKSIAEQTRDLPDVQGAANATDRSIANAFSSIAKIENHAMSAQDVHGKLNVLADETAAQSGGRMGTWGGIGAGVGLVAGGAIGFFAGGKNIKNAAIGAGVGLAVAGGGGAIAGHMRDQSFLAEAKSLRELANDVTAYNPESAKKTLTQETQNTYNQILHARNFHDLDNARVSTNNLNAIQGRVAPVESQAARILGAYEK